MAELRWGDTRVDDPNLANCCKRTIRGVIAEEKDELVEDGMLLHCYEEKRGTAWLKLNGKNWRFMGANR